jgi:hypothetical protein
VRRFAVTKGCKACEGTLLSRVVIEVISNPIGITLAHPRGCTFFVALMLSVDDHGHDWVRNGPRCGVWLPYYHRGRRGQQRPKVFESVDECTWESKVHGGAGPLELSLFPQGIRNDRMGLDPKFEPRCGLRVPSTSNMRNNV